MSKTVSADNLNDPITKYLRKDVTPLQIGQTVGRALEFMRQNPPPGRIVYFYVVDDDNRLCGVVPTRRLLLSPPEMPITEIMVKDCITLPVDATVLDACDFFTLHRFLALPVVDDQRRLIGTVDIELYADEITDLAERTGYDDLFQLIGVRVSEAQQGSAVGAFKIRFPWLICNIVGGILAAFLSGAFQEVLDRLILIALFIPVVLALSESVSIQSVSLAIQSFHGGGWNLARGLRAMRRELFTGLLLGAAAGFAVALVALIWKGAAGASLVIWTSISVSVAVSCVFGLAMPLSLRLLKFDPRVAAGPIALVVADLFTLTVYFSLASKLA